MRRKYFWRRKYFRILSEENMVICARPTTKVTIKIRKERYSVPEETHHESPPDEYGAPRSTPDDVFD
jgi:hypothetical protein